MSKKRHLEWQAAFAALRRDEVTLQTKSKSVKPTPTESDQVQVRARVVAPPAISLAPLISVGAAVGLFSLIPGEKISGIRLRKEEGRRRIKPN